MTSVPPAEPRPPPLRPPDLVRSRTNSAFGFDNLTGRSKAESGLSRPAEDLNVDGRPLKRRKTDHLLPTETIGSEKLSWTSEQHKAQPKSRLIGDLRLLSAIIAGPPRDDGESQDVEPPPLPTRPWRVVKPPPTAEEPKPTHRARAILKVPTSPDTAGDSVPNAPLGNKPVGYFPWKGRHPEDALSETNVKQGYFDRTPNPPERELSTARVPLYHAFKHREGVESLSALFSLVLDAKNKHGLLSSASTFKPPPRVTLAEAKRRSWIVDLADPNVPLRKLSRTIPQGIRGHILLDQCLQNSVPLSRAIWFAKCVGANEIRTLKRKGTTPAAAVGTETKWLREWTLNVEQFIETVLSQCAQPDWRTNIQYALRLTTRLYLENLIDRDHYVDWMVKAFSASSDDHLPFWLMVVHIYKQDIARFRIRATNLVEALLSRYTGLEDSNNVATQSLAAKLKVVIRGFFMSRPDSFLIPEAWSKIREGLRHCLSEDNPIETRTMERLERANLRCMGVNRQQYLTKPDPADLVVDLLDSAQLPYDIGVLSAELFAACGSLDILVTCCLDWATTKFRCGSSRTYLTSRLLRKWHRQGHDVESPLLNFITECRNRSESCNTNALRHLVAELSRSHTFPNSKYLQWLNVRGLPRPGTCLSMVHNRGVRKQTCTEDSEVLMDLSLLDVKVHLVNQRNALLARAGFDAGAESAAIKQIETRLEQHLSSKETSDMDPSLPDLNLTELLSGCNWNMRSQISRWIRSFVAEKDKLRIPREDKHPLQDGPPISIHHFAIIRASLEILEDEAILADVIGLCSSFKDEQLQAALVETITRHRDAFSAIGALEPLQTRLCTLYMYLRTVKSTMPLLATAVLDLCSAMPSKVIPVRLLQQDLVRGDRGRAVAACSPFSDGIAESLQHAESTFIEDFEAVLRSEPSMNEQTMTRLFAVLTERIGKQGQGSDSQILFTYCQLMARLRLCRKQQGDQLIRLWLMKVLYKGSSIFVQNLFFNMVGTGGLSIDIFLAAYSTVGKAGVSMAQILPGDKTAKHVCHYSVLTKWEDFARRKPAAALNVVSDLDASARKVFDTTQLCALLVLRQSEGLPQLSKSAEKVLEDILHEHMVPGGGIKGIFQNLDKTSLPFVQARLRLLSQTPTTEDDKSVAQSINDMIFDKSAEASSGSHISMLLQVIGTDIASNVRHLAEEHIQGILPKLPTRKSPETESFDLEDAQFAIDQTFLICHGSSTPSAKSALQLIDRLSQLLKFLGHTNPPASPAKLTSTSPTSASTPQFPNIASQLLNPSSPIDANAPRSLPPNTIEYFRLLLQFLCLVRPTPSPTDPRQPPPPTKPQSNQIKILILLASLITHPFLTSPSTIFPDNPHAISQADEVLSFAYDVMATYVDDLSDEGRALSAKILRDKLREDREGRLRWLFGSIAGSGSEIRGGEEMGRGLVVSRKGEGKGEWRPRVWEVLEGGRGGDGETSLGLGLFGARR